MKNNIRLNISLPVVFLIICAAIPTIWLGSWYGWESPNSLGGLGIIFYGGCIIISFLFGLVGLLVGYYKKKPWIFMFYGYGAFITSFIIWVIWITH